ncbi:hypothetical protein LRAMOSA06950 [Lichtheimia ramosa]|uniref:Uncharacterized protein n=1 Tax=Lichtheimia ramosa TaxID=688394 RepID=A0A077WB74_9FUNG|nr:hypothetical protein LRAMOSA06950 [Lichtheimia ramosa]
MAAVRAVDVPALTSLTSVIESITAAPSTNTPLLSYAQSAYSRVSSEVQWSESQAAQQSASATQGNGASGTNGAGGAGASDTNGAGGAGASDTNGGGGAGGASATAASTGGTGNGQNSQSAGSSTQAMLLSASVSVFLASFAAMLA